MNGTSSALSAIFAVPYEFALLMLAYKAANNVRV